MLMRIRGGEVATCALLLALMSLTAFMSVCSGCRPPSIISSGRQSVRTDALLPLHPAWAQIESLGRIRAQFAAQSLPNGVVAPDLSSLPVAFPPPKDLPNSTPEQRLQHAEASSDQYLKQLADTLRLQDEAYVARLSRRQAQSIQATYAKELSAREAAIRAERMGKALQLDNQITRLKFRDVAFQTQIRVYKGQALRDAQLQHDALLSQIKTLTGQATTLLVPSGISNAALAAVKPRLEELRRQADQERERELAARASRRATQLEQEKSKLTFNADPLPPINETPLPAPDSRETPLVLPPGTQVGAAFQSADNALRAKRVQQEAAWSRQRARILAAIAADTEKAVEQIARQKGWNLVSPGTRGAQDETDTIKPLLRQQWMQGRTE